MEFGVEVYHTHHTHFVCNIGKSAVTRWRLCESLSVVAASFTIRLQA